MQISIPYKYTFCIELRCSMFNVRCSMSAGWLRSVLVVYMGYPKRLSILLKSSQKYKFSLCALTLGFNFQRLSYAQRKFFLYIWKLFEVFLIFRRWEFCNMETKQFFAIKRALPKCRCNNKSWHGAAQMALFVSFSFQLNKRADSPKLRMWRFAWKFL